jgi:NADP-dependent 3-hydroxy acid dehydrogenase YdfG
MAGCACFRSREMEIEDGVESTLQVVMVTGASRGLGAATARIFLEMGAAVVLTARSEAELQSLANAGRSRPASARWWLRQT